MAAGYGVVNFGRPFHPDLVRIACRFTYTWAHYYLGLVLLARGERNAALMEIQQERTDEAKRQGLAMVYYALDRKADSDSTITSMLQEDADVNAFGIAEAYASRTEPDKAMQWLDRAYAQKDSAMYYLKGDPPLKTLERDPRYKTFLKKMNLPE
jgi:tetratricopeptide (TPR) repeat protein